MNLPRPSAVLMIDPHAVFRKVIPDYSFILRRGRFLMHAALRLGMDVWVTRHCPDKLGDLDGVLDFPDDVPVLDKETFSAYESLRRRIVEAKNEVSHWFVCGVETHICVWQTVRDMLAGGWTVCVMADAVGSRWRVDHDFALQRMAAAGAMLSTTEAVVYEWLGSVHHPVFKEVVNLIKECDAQLRRNRAEH